MTETQPTPEQTISTPPPVVGETLKNEEAPKKRCIGVRFTPDGEKAVWQLGDRQWTEEPEDKPFVMPLKGFKQDHHLSMLAIAECVRQIKMKKRSVPLTRPEAEHNGVTKKMLKELERYGLVKVHSQVLVNKATGKPQSSQCLVYFTPQGNAYMREKVLKPLMEAMAQREKEKAHAHTPAVHEESSQESPAPADRPQHEGEDRPADRSDAESRPGV